MSDLFLFFTYPLLTNNEIPRIFSKSSLARNGINWRRRLKEMRRIPTSLTSPPTTRTAMIELLNKTIMIYTMVILNIDIRKRITP